MTRSRAGWRRAATALLLAAGTMLTPRPGFAADAPFVYGVTIADASAAPGRSFDLARQAGFTHAYVVVNWKSIEPEPGQFAWSTGQANDLDNFLMAARATGLRLIVRLGSEPPAWAGMPATQDPAVLERFARAVAARGRGVVAAYEILNEPNLPYEWGGAPDPSQYARLLAAARRGIKAGDDSALVVAAGLAPNTGGLGGTMEDVEFLRRLYAAGARGSFDVLGMHPYGGNMAPETDPAACGICFRRAEAYRQVMVDNGDAATSAWVTEFGYLQTTSVDLGQYNWLKLSPEQQAANLVGAYRYASASWPWLSGMVAFNLDFDTVPWIPNTLGAYWFALLNPDRTPRPAYTAIKAMSKPGAAQPLLVTAPPVPAVPMPAAPAPSAPGVSLATPSVPAPGTVRSGDVVCQTFGRSTICGPALLVPSYRR